MRDTFSQYHPLVNLLYFALVLLFSMLIMHPATLLLSLTGALAYASCLRGWRAAGRSFLRLLPIPLLAAAINPLFSHEGVTILTYLPSGNPLTLESILYGLGAAVMLAAVITWFSCFTAVMTSDKFIYLFGRVIPALSLVLSMTLRFVPRFKAQFRAVSEARRGMGLAGGTLMRRAESGAAALSAMVTWSLENAIDTADSMKSRGYGLPGRTSYSVYRLESRDKAALAWLGWCGFYLICGALAGGFSWRYYPALGGGALTALTVSLQLCYLLLCLTPVFLHVVSERRWRHQEREAAENNAAS